MARFVMAVTSDGLREVIGQLSERLDDLTPAMRQISGVLAGGIDEAFDRQADPVTGTPWQKLSDTTIARREATGHWPGKIMQVSGHLATSFTPDYGKTFAAAGTNAIQAAVMNFGAQRGAFGHTKRGAPIPWGDIPARPMVGISPDVDADVIDIISKYLIA